MFGSKRDNRKIRCREAGKRLIGSTDLSVDDREALARHLEQCPHCARLAEAQRLLTRDIDTIRQSEPAGTLTTGKVRNLISSRIEQESKMNIGVKVMKKINEEILRRPRLSMASAALVIILLVSIIVPIKSKSVFEYEVAFASPVPEMVLDRNFTETLLADLSLDEARVEISESEAGTEYKIAPLTDTTKVKRLMETLDSLGGKDVRPILLSAKTGEKQNVWEMILDDKPDSLRLKHGVSYYFRVDEDKFDKLPPDNYVLWIPGEKHDDDSTSGILLNRENGKTNIWISGAEIKADENGWNPWFRGNTAVYFPATGGLPEGYYDMNNVDDVRKLEKMGYDFGRMKFGEPRDSSARGTSPRITEIKTDDSQINGVIIGYSVPQASMVKLDIIGEDKTEIRSLVNQIVLAGNREATWNLLNNAGEQVKPGTYYCLLTVDDYQEAKKIVVK